MEAWCQQSSPKDMHLKDSDFQNQGDEEDINAALVPDYKYFGRHGG